MTNPYQTPSSEARRPYSGKVDTSNPFSSKGRFGRLSYLAWSFVFTLVLFFGLFIVAVVLGVDNPESADSTAMNVISFVFMTAFAIPGIIFGIRRLHDTDKPAYWIILVIIPIISLGLWFYLVLKAGSPGTNAFGPPRPTLGWERTAGYLMIGFLILSTIGGIIFLLMAPQFTTA